MSDQLLITEAVLHFSLWTIAGSLFEGHNNPGKDEPNVFLNLVLLLMVLWYVATFTFMLCYVAIFTSTFISYVATFTIMLCYVATFTLLLLELSFLICKDC